MLNESDFGVLSSVAELKWYSFCRCHLSSVCDGSTAHEHIHALIHFCNRKPALVSRKRLQKIDQKLHPKSKFKKIFVWTTLLEF